MTLSDWLVLTGAIVHGFTWLTIAGNLFYLRRHAPGSADPPPGRLSVLIPARNEESNLRRLIPSLLEQRHPDFEIIVVDDASEDDTAAVIASFDDPRLGTVSTSGPPDGWAGKVHALFQATRAATGERYLFLDADTEWLRPDSLARVDALFAALPAGSVLTALPRLRGGGMLLVSLVSAIILSGLPWPLVRPLRFSSLGALNGQGWLIDAVSYHRLEPHERHPGEILEDVVIGRYLKREGMTPVLADLRLDLAVHMYRDTADAWVGFRKNAYLILGGTPWLFALLWTTFAVAFGAAPLLSWALLASLFGIKAICDRIMRLPYWVTLLAPLSYWMGIVLQADSAFSHWTGRVSWKGRRMT